MNQALRKVLHYKIPPRQWEIVGTDVLIINAKTLLSIVDYHSKFQIVKKVNSLSTDNLVNLARLIFAEYWLHKKKIFRCSTNFTSKTFRDFCRKINIQQTIALPYHHQSNGQVEAFIKFVKCTIKKCPDTNRHIFYFIADMLVGTCLPHTATMLFNRQITGLLSQMNRNPIFVINDDLHHEAHQRKNDEGKATPKDPSVFIA